LWWHKDKSRYGSKRRGELIGRSSEVRSCMKCANSKSAKQQIMPWLLSMRSYRPIQEEKNNAERSKVFYIAHFSTREPDKTRWQKMEHTKTWLEEKREREKREIDASVGGDAMRKM